VVLQLVEEGKLRLDQTPADILDGATLRDIPNATTATLAQMMSHSSGIPSWEEDPRWIRDARGDGYDPKRQWPETAALSYIRGAKPLGGARYHYSNTNYTLLGLMVEKVTGNRLMAEIRRRILVPLSLKDTYLEGFEAVPEERVAGRYHFATAGYRQAAGMSKIFPEVRPGLIDVSASRLSPEWAAGGIVTTASDLVKFAVALRDGRLLKPASLRFMMQWRPTDVPGMEVGHGLFRNLNADGTHKINHTGGVLGFSAEMGWLEESDMAMAFLYNAGSVDSGHVPLDWTGEKAFAQAARAYAGAHSSCGGANGTR
jgi:D-alanyl-D-alanine carboxypeptidase